MAELSSRERIIRAIHHQETDRIPIHDQIWNETLLRWREEGLPEDVDIAEYLGWDKVATYGASWRLGLPEEVLEETDRYTIVRGSNGEIVKNLKSSSNPQHSTTQWLDFTIKDRKTWEEYRGYLKPTRERVRWETLASNQKARSEGAFIMCLQPHGFDMMAQIIGQDTLLMAMVDDPEWVKDMFEVSTDMAIGLITLMMEEGFEFDAGFNTDDLGYRNGPFFSPKYYRELLLPSHKRFCDFCHENNMVTVLHSCGNIKDLIPDLIDAGWDVLNPLEVKAGMDVRDLKGIYGDKLCFFGGIDVRLMSNDDAIEEEVASKVTVAKVGGGYIYHSDHSVSEDVSLKQYKRVMELVKKYGSYDS